VENIALNCGFSNAAHFIRSFKSFTGFTPGLFRKYFSDVSMGMELRRFWDL
jgi:AraC-like DNA-binding protein